MPPECMQKQWNPRKIRNFDKFGEQMHDWQKYVALITVNK